MIESKLIRFLMESRDNYIRYYNIIYNNSLLKESYIIYNNIDIIYNTNPTRMSIDLDDLLIHTNFHEGGKLSTAQLSTITTMIKHAGEVELPDASIIKILVERYYSEQMTQVATRVYEGKEDALKIKEVSDKLDAELNKLAGRETVSYEFTDDAEEVLTELHSEEGTLEWRLPQLNKVFGRCGKGEFIMVASRPDGGKTTFLTSECSYFATQSEKEKPIVWFANEESYQRIKSRFIQSALAVTNGRIREDKSEIAEAYYDKYGRDPIVIYRKPSITLAEVEDIVGKYNPDVVVFDQLYKMELGRITKDMETERYRKIAQFARDVATKQGMVFGTAWLDSSAEGELYPPQSAMYMSKTGVQGEADAILTIGVSNDADDVKKRYFNVPKNKLIGASEEYRNAKFEVNLDREIGRYR